MESSEQKGTVWDMRKVVQILFLLTALFLLSYVVYVRQQCILAGYTISELSRLHDDQLVVLQELEIKRTGIMNIETLYRKAAENGFTQIDGGRTFHVR